MLSCHSNTAVNTHIGLLVDTVLISLQKIPRSRIASFRRFYQTVFHWLGDYTPIAVQANLGAPHRRQHSCCQPTTLVLDLLAEQLPPSAIIQPGFFLGDTTLLSKAEV